MATLNFIRPVRISALEFQKAPNKAITLLGMSGVGKTKISSKLPRSQWFHYSGDYRIGTKYLDEVILDNIKKHAMEHPYLRNLLCKDAIYIRNNITNDHLQPISLYLGKIGSPDLGGLSVKEFKFRQRLFRQAEINAMQDVSVFMNKSRTIYGYPHFINDAGGSICYLSDEECWHSLSRNTVILYLNANKKREAELVKRALKKPKPLFYEESFLDENLKQYNEKKGIKSEQEIVPDEFVQYMFPKLLEHRRPLYEKLARQYGYTIEAKKLHKLCKDPSIEEKDIIEFICQNLV